VKVSDHTDELDYCPSCSFGKVDFAKHKATMGFGYTTDWNSYKPLLYKDRLLGKWVVECQNCGMEVLFSLDEAETVTAWNDMPRNAEKL
jgi:hypothetical protein